MGVKKTNERKPDTELKVLRHLENLEDERTNVYYEILGELKEVGWKTVSSGDKSEKAIASPDGKYIFHFVLSPHRERPYFGVESVGSDAGKGKTKQPPFNTCGECGASVPPNSYCPCCAIAGSGNARRDTK